MSVDSATFRRTGEDGRDYDDVAHDHARSRATTQNEVITQYQT